MADPSPARPPLSRYVQWYFSTLVHSDLLYYRWTLSCLLCGYLLCLLVFVPKVLPLYPTVAWRVLQWGSLSAAVTLVAAVALRFVDPGSVTATTEPTALHGSAAVTTDAATLCPHCRTAHAARTRYCRRCRLCVRRFDHHCAITDLCIGQANYRLFLLTVLAGLVTACLGSYLTVHLTLAQLSAQPLYHPRSVLAVATCCCLSYAAFLLLSYAAVHAVLLFSNRTLVEMWAHRRERRKQGEWSLADRGAWRRRWASVAEVLTAGGHAVRCVELRDKESALSYEQRQAAEGWKDDGDGEEVPDEMGCVPSAGGAV